MKKMKTTELKKQPGTLELMKEAAKNMWRWFTAAPETINNLNYSEELENERILIEQKEIKGTPFKVIGNKEKGYWIALGPYRLTELLKTKQEAINSLETEKWNIVARLVNITHEFEKRQQEEKYKAGTINIPKNLNK